ncbi:CD1107 family mobile element protein [Ethanoligenens sp.]|uniref:CD1107 family mobile element protein n=1 Tax=Ethanoligenens sp. TaxID=2099655 RepID=UPI0039E91EE0
MMKIRKLLISTAAAFGVAAVCALSASADTIPVSGTGTVIGNATVDASQCEFETIKTADGSVLYLVVDKSNTTGQNVYLLTPVTEDTLRSMIAGASSKNSIIGGGTTSSGSGFLGGLGGGTSSTSGTGTVSSAPSGTSSGSTSAVKETNAQKVSNSLSGHSLLFVLVIAALGIGGGYYFKIYKPKHGKKITPDGMDMDDDDLEDPDEEDNASTRSGRRKPAGDEDKEYSRKSSTREPVSHDDAGEQPNEEEGNSDDTDEDADTPPSLLQNLNQKKQDAKRTEAERSDRYDEEDFNE